MADGNKKERKHWLTISSFIVAATLFVGANLSFSRLPVAQQKTLSQTNFDLDKDEKNTSRPYSWWVSRAYLNEAQAPDVFLFGSSQLGCLHAAEAKVTGKTMDWALDHHSALIESSLEKGLGKPVSVFACGTPGAVISDFYVIGRALFSTGKKPSVVVITCAPRDFVDNLLPGISSTEPFRYFSPFINGDKKTYDVLYPSAMDQLNWRMKNFLTLKRVESLIPSAISSDKAPQTAANQSPADQNAPKVGAGWLQAINTDMAAVKPGQVTNDPNMPTLFVDNRQEYDRRYKNPFSPMYEQQLKCFEAFLDYLHQEGIKVVVVTMPLTNVNRDQLPAQFWNKFIPTIARTCYRYDAKYIDLTASNDFKSSDYADVVHMNASGGLKLVDKLGEILASDTKIAAALSHAKQQVATSKKTRSPEDY